MRHHVTIHTGEKPYRCPYCQNSYTQKKIMNKHIRRAHPGYEIPAPTPRKKSNIIRTIPQNQDPTLVKHDVEAENNEGNAVVETLKQRILQDTEVIEMQVYKCKYCEKLFNNITHLTNHENIHIQTKHYQCGTCGKMFKRPEGLTRHIGKHTGGFQCSNCGVYLPTYTKLQLHEEEHLFKCKMCKRKHETKAELNEHMKVHMKNTDRYQCMHCMKILATKSSLREHEKIHTEKIKCKFCSKEFVSHYMKKHLRTHSGDHPYLCKHCPDRRYTTPNALRVHMRRRHFRRKQHGLTTKRQL
ncbi:zinc finger Y-chromosomal protein 1-like [Amphiura filiformis]|uniref:zinc finger Y-chromosomal protein 1-like n=1 Tax=Amphiura filiformis TaxID=82378 RepID=UPI003B2205D7